MLVFIDDGCDPAPAGVSNHTCGNRVLGEGSPRNRVLGEGSSRNRSVEESDRIKESDISSNDTVGAMTLNRLSGGLLGGVFGRVDPLFFLLFLLGDVVSSSHTSIVVGKPERTMACPSKSF